MASVEESDVGIICYISHLPGFRGILKHSVVKDDSYGGARGRLGSLWRDFGQMPFFTFRH